MCNLIHWLLSKQGFITDNHQSCSYKYCRQNGYSQVLFPEWKQWFSVIFWGKLTLDVIPSTIGCFLRTVQLVFKNWVNVLFHFDAIFSVLFLLIMFASFSRAL